MSRRNRGDGGFSKRGQGGSRQDEVGRTIFDRVAMLMQNRWMYLNQFDLFKDVQVELYRYAMTEREWEAWQLLEQNKEFRRAMSYVERVLIHNPDAGFNITVYVPKARFVSIVVMWENLPYDHRERIHNWLIRSESYRQEYTTIRDRVKSLTRLCSTPGQIERVWPELMGFMPGHVIDTRLAKTVKSPYPDGVWEEGWELLHPNERKLKEMYRPEVLSWFNDALAESLILPMQDWGEKPPFPDVSLLK